MIIEYLREHPMYIPFLLFNIYVIYKVILMVAKGDNNDKDDEDDDDDFHPEGPDLDLPPGVSLPIDEDLVEEGAMI